jgi:hypothetical protein
MGHFNEESLHKFNLMCSEGVNFAEGDSYDFARCIKSTGEIYDVSPGEVCKEGKPISDAKAERKGGGKSNSRMAKLRAAFIKKWKREMSSEELEKARNMINRPKAQKKGE